MNDTKLMELIKIWLEEATRNQESITHGYRSLLKRAEWNEGYLSCLKDLAGIIKENS